MRPSVLVLVLFIFSIKSFSQKLISDIVDPKFNNSSLIFNYGDFNGTPYLFEDWRNIEIHTNQNGVIKNEKAKLDIYSNKVLVLFEDKHIWVNDLQIKYFVLDNGSGSRIKFIRQTSAGNTVFYEVIHEGRLNLYRAYSKRFVRPNENANHNYGAEVSEKPYFNREVITYYINFDDEKLVKTTLSKKAIENILPEKHKRKYKQLLKREKVSFKREEELKSFLQHFETEIKE